MAALRRCSDAVAYHYQRADCPCGRAQFEAAWALTNVASGSTDQCQQVVDAGGARLFARLLSVSDTAVRTQAAWALGNITGDGVSRAASRRHPPPTPAIPAARRAHAPV